MFLPPAQTSVRGDWDDVPASVLVAAQLCEMALAKTTEIDDRQARFDIVTALNEPVIVHAHRLGELVELRAAVGRFGDHAREQALLQRVAERLSDLRGVETAPVRE